ncbi:MAG: hypothetical protein ACREDQ_02955 [Limisphaerales bacterium]
MKITLRISLILNLALLAGLIFLLTNQRNPAAAPAPALPEARSSAQTAEDSAPPKTTGVEPASFHWGQLVSAKDYRLYVANLRAIGCPEATIEDIVRGDTERAFAWERSQLSLDESGNGPWSQAREAQLVSSLLSGQSPAETAALAQGTKNPLAENDGSEVAQAPVPSPSAGGAASHYPLFLQNVNWSTLGFTPEQQSAITQLRQQFQNKISGLNQIPGSAANQNAGTAGTGDTPSNSNPNDVAALTQWQTALQSADDQLRALLGAQGYAAYQQQQYYAWYQPQVLANAGGGGLTINPEAFSSK